MDKWTAAFALLLGLGLLAGSADADEFWSLLEGRWSGMGTIGLDGGGSERLKCQAAYDVQGAGHVAQRLTCVSPSYRIDGSADLIFDGSRLSGTWSERSYGVGGGLAGTSNGGQIAFQLDAPTFTGNTTIEVQRCRQTIRVSLSGTIIKTINVGLRRC